MTTNEIVTISISAAALLISALLAINTFRLFKRSEIQNNEAKKKDLYDSIKRYFKYTTKKTEENGKGQMNFNQAVTAIKKSYTVGYQKKDDKGLKPAHKLVHEMYNKFLFEVQTADCIKMDVKGHGYNYKIDLKSKSIKDLDPINKFLNQTRNSLSIIRDLANFAKLDGKVKGGTRRDLLWILNVKKRSDEKGNKKTNILVGKELNAILDKAYADITGMQRNFSNAVTNSKYSKAYNSKEHGADKSVKAAKELLLRQNEVAKAITGRKEVRDIDWHDNAVGKQIIKIVRTYDAKEIEVLNNNIDKEVQNAFVLVKGDK